MRLPGKNPAFQFYPSDWMADTGKLTPSARGIWIDLLCEMWRCNPRGKTSGTPAELARSARCTEEEMVDTIAQFERHNICDLSRDGHGIVTLMSRRMVRDDDSRKEWRNRQQNHRSKRTSKNNVTRLSRLSHALSSSSCPTDIPPKPPTGGLGGELLFGALQETGKLPSMTKEHLASWMRYAGDRAEDEAVRMNIWLAVSGFPTTIARPDRVMPQLVHDAAFPRSMKNIGPAFADEPERRDVFDVRKLS